MLIREPTLERIKCRFVRDEINRTKFSYSFSHMREQIFEIRHAFARIRTLRDFISDEKLFLGCCK